MVSVTTMPRSQCSPAFLASSMLGRMPTAITTRSAGSSVPSAKRTAVTRSVAQDRLRLRRHLEHHAALFQRLAQQSARDRVELALHQRVASDARR